MISRCSCHLIHYYPVLDSPLLHLQPRSERSLFKILTRFNEEKKEKNMSQSVFLPNYTIGTDAYEKQMESSKNMGKSSAD